MKTLQPFQSSSAPFRAASSKFILSGLIAATASLVFAASGAAQSTTQPFSAFPVTVDGQFTNPLEWSDVTPSAFISSPGTTAVPTTLGNPLANSLLYATLARSTPAADPALYLMYDFLPRTNTLVAPREVFASVAFQITLPGRPTGDRTSIAVLFAGKGASTFKGDSGVAVPSFFDVFIDLNLDGNPDGLASTFGIIGSAGFGPSSLSAIPHLLVELEVPLRIPAGFANPPAPGGPLPGGGINPATGLYDPDPIFWGAAGGADGGPTASFGETLQSASGGIFEINPDGSTTITPTPEPTSAALLLGSLGLFAARRRRAVPA